MRETIPKAIASIILVRLFSRVNADAKMLATYRRAKTWVTTHYVAKANR
jgi:hypothetical protein